MISDEDLVELDKLIYYYVAYGWPRYTKQEAPHPNWTDAMSRVQTEAMNRHRERHLLALKTETVS